VRVQVFDAARQNLVSHLGGKTYRRVTDYAHIADS
jgi:hypothetical protein